MATLINPNANYVAVGLGTFSCTVPTAGYWTVVCNSTIPHDASGSSADSTESAISALECNIKLNSSSKSDVGGSASNPTPTQPLLGNSARILCAASDVLNIVLSSTNANDSALNAVKTTISVFQS